MGLLDRISFQRTPVPAPEAIDVTPANEFRILWPGGPEVTIAAKRLRDQCPCAECIEEGTGRKLLDPASIPDDIRPTDVTAVGAYAIQIRWSDGHATGLYSWDVRRRASGLAD